MTDQKTKNKGKDRAGPSLPSGLFLLLIASYFQRSSALGEEVPAASLRVVVEYLPRGVTNGGTGKVPGI